VNVESAVYGLIVGLAIGLVAWRLGPRPYPRREAIASVLLYIALSLGLIASGVAPTESITIAVIGSALLVASWKRFAPRRSEGSV
jgi:hypothetical protein